MIATLRDRIRDVPDFPRKGIVFKDITPVLADPPLFREVVDALAARWKGQGGEVAGYAFVVELSFLDGARRLGGPEQVHSLLRYEHP